VLIETDLPTLEQKFRERGESRVWRESRGLGKSSVFLHFKLELDEALSPEVFM
jgi:hypothetical protein